VNQRANSTEEPTKRVYVTAIAGGHDVDVAVYASRSALEATGDFEPDDIDTAEAEGQFVDDYGALLVVTEVIA
jgi:hypothetical protein